MSFPSIPIRGPQDLNQPFLTCCYSSSLKVIYLLTEVDYTDESGNPIQEIILNPCFDGDFAYPYTSGSPTERGQQYFLAYAYSPGVGDPPVAGYATYLPNYQTLTSPLPVSSVSPFISVYTAAPSGGSAAGMILKQYSSSGASTAKYVSLDLPPASQDPKQFLCRTLLTTDINKALVFNVGGGNNFFVKNNNVYAGYPYKLSANGLPSSTTTAFRNFNAFTAINGNDSNYRITTYNRRDRTPLATQYYVGNTDNSGSNWLFPLLGTSITTTVPSGSTVVPTFQGQTIISNVPNFSKVKNLDYGDLTYFFLPLTYYPSNFTINGINPGLGNGQCFLITSSSAPDVTIVLNYLYFAWASGYPPPSSISGSYQYPITNQPPGFIQTGKGALNLAGWTSSAECNRGYYYDYCGASDYCGKCFGGCSTSTKPFCDDNRNFTQFTESSGAVNPFECEATQTPPKAFSWWWVGGFLLAMVIFLVGAIVIVVLEAVKKRQTPRDSLLKQYQSASASNTSVENT